MTADNVLDALMAAGLTVLAFGVISLLVIALALSRPEQDR